MAKNKEVVEMAEERSNGSGWTLAAFITGAIFGAGLAFLLAPEPGKETRKKVLNEAERLKELAMKKAAELIEEAKKKMEEKAQQAAPEETEEQEENE